MKILGLDIASNVGWSLIEGEKLIEFGSIKCIQPLSIQMKLNFYYDEIERLILRIQPDICVLEDIIMGISGVKVLVYLARLNAIGILACVKGLDAYKVYLYTPAEWKKECNLNLNGMAQKWEIQLATCLKFNKINQDDDLFKKWKIISEEINKGFNDLRIQSNNLIETKNKLKAELARKKKDIIIGDERTLKEEQLKNIEVEILKIKNNIKNYKKISDKKMVEFSNDIYYKTGISTDVADSIGLCLCFQNLNKKGEIKNG